MSIERERYNGPISFVCDSCYDVEETHCEDFDSALAKAKSHGWKARNINGEWHHYCKDCNQ